MKTTFYYLLTTLAVVAGAFAAGGQTVFDENFDGGYTAAFGTGGYSGGSPTGTSTTVLSSGGNPNGCAQIQMTATTSGDTYTGQLQLMGVTGNTDSNPADYSISFDANGSQAANVQFIIQTWSGAYFGGSQEIQATDNNQLTAANTWQTFTVNLGNLTSANPTGVTWQLEFQINASQWGGAGKTDTLKIDNIILTHLANELQLSASENPVSQGTGISFIGTILSNNTTATAATGQVIFSDANGAFSTNTVSHGIATSAALANLPVGMDTISASYTGNFPSSVNTYAELVNTSSGSPVTETNLPVFTDNAVNGFQTGYSWATINVKNTSPVHSGTYAISVNDGGNQALEFRSQDFNSTPYTSVTFWINGGSSGGQRLKVAGLLDGVNQSSVTLSQLSKTWQQITIPLSSLGVANQPNFDGFWILGTTGSSQATFYVDDVALVNAAIPATVHLGVNAANVLETVDARQSGLNTATWDSALGAPETLPLLQEIGTGALRWPGGSTADDYDWASDPGGNATFRNLARSLGAQVFTTVNYGTGTASEAAAWVLDANQTNNCNFKYWEVGNECYGSWETDDHAIQHDPYTYATNAAAYIQQMKAAYPAVPIKVGVVVVPGENSYVNNTNNYAVNHRTGQTNYGWTPIVLSELKALGVTPDFLIYHYYAQYTGTWTPGGPSADSDQYLLQVAGNPSPSTWSDWNSAAANLRQQITDYLGATNGTNIELCVTENNSDSGDMGRQSTSVVNALYLADSTCELMKTEFRSYVWWDLHNGPDTEGDFDPTLYGWRASGDFGITDPSDNPYPTFYAEKMLSAFARAGDSVLNGTSDNLMLAAYAAQRTNGELTMLVINKDLGSAIAGQIALTNFVPGSDATVLSWGIPQDQADELGETGPALDVVTNNLTVGGTIFTYTFPPLSLTLFTFAPGPATLSAKSVQGGEAELLLGGNTGVPYVIEGSSDLKNWTVVSTNTIAAGNGTITVPATNAVQEYYRAVWKP